MADAGDTRLNPRSFTPDYTHSYHASPKRRGAVRISNKTVFKVYLVVRVLIRSITVTINEKWSLLEILFFLIGAFSGLHACGGPKIFCPLLYFTINFLTLLTQRQKLFLCPLTLDLAM